MTDNFIKQTLCDELIEAGKVTEYDVIKHSYTRRRMNEWEERNIETNNLSPTLDTRADTLGVVVKGSLFENEYGSQAGRIYDVDGASPTLNTGGGGYRIPIIEVEDENV